jgi:DNA-binding transcriptional ArsR family regulator
VTEVLTMPAMKSIPSPGVAEQAVEAMAGYFCRVADTFGLPRSVALIYHALFVAEQPLSFTEIVDHSGLSKGSASTGLKMLERMRAVEVVVVPTSRSTYYRPELSLRRLTAGFLQHSLLPGLDAGGRLLDTAPSSEHPKLPDQLRQRLSSLRHWHETSQGLLPMLAALSDPDSSR